GTYQFDPLPGTYRIIVTPPLGLYEFPADALPIGGTAAAPFGALAASGPNNQVSPFAQPQQGQVNPYYLRFVSDGTRGELLNNHVPLAPVTGKVRLTILARLKRITTGDQNVVTVTLTNGSKTPLPEPLLAPMSLSFDIPTGFKSEGAPVVRDV